jgi:glycosyltransferase involved in cell wall biosynthesis
VAFVNGGILGLTAMHDFLVRYLPRQSVLAADHIVLTENLGTMDRVIRAAMCQRLWKDGALGLTNVDLARFRQEMHAGMLTRRRLARVGRPDVIHFHRQATAYGSLDLMERIPSIVSIDATQDVMLESATTSVERASYLPNVRMDGAIFRRASAIVSASRWAAGLLRVRYPDIRTPVHVLPSPVLLDYMDRAWIARRRERARRGVRPRFLFMGGDFPRKGGPDLLAAWREGGFGQKATLELVTDWPVGDDLPPGVIITRAVKPLSPEWIQRWAEADAFVLPTRHEAFGLVFQESAGAGLPAIGTRHNAIPEIVKDGETGLLVPRGDRSALVNAMAALLESAELRQRMGERGRAMIEELASPDRYLAKLTGIILDACRRGAGGNGHE